MPFGERNSNHQASICCVVFHYDHFNFTGAGRLIEMANSRALRFAKPLCARHLSGALAALTAAYNFPVSKLDLRFPILAFLTLVFGSRIVVQILESKDKFRLGYVHLLTMLMFDGEAAILLAAADAFCSSVRVTKKKFTALFNTGTFVCSTFATVTF